MLTETMTHAEVYRELDRDRDTATTWWRHHLDTLRRPVLKARQLPVIHWADYTSPARRIRYLFFTRIFDKRMRRLLTGVAVPHRTPDGTAVYTSWLSDQRLIAPMVILPHAWQRYRERTGCNLTDEEKRIRRMAEEYDQLTERYGKLSDFLTTDKFGTLPENTQTLMKRQHQAMHDYREALRQRIRIDAEAANLKVEINDPDDE